MVKITNRFKLLTGFALLSSFVANVSFADEIDTNIAQMQAMDKITGRVSVIDVPVNGSVNFGSFSIVVRACKTRPPEDTPENFAFVDVVDNYKKETLVNIFRGWMISSSPALNPVEHPIYDVWLLKCINGKVDPSQLLSKEDLASRDALPKAPIFTEEAKLKANEDAKVEAEENLQKNLETENKDVPSSPQVMPMEETKLENLNISNPPAFEQEVQQPEPIIQEDGAPKSLLNIGNDFVPPEQKNSSENSENDLPQEDVLSLGTDDDVEKTSTESNKASAVQEDAKTGFLGKILNLGSEEEKTDDASDVIKNEKELTPDDVPDKADSSIDVDEIDKELMQMQ